MTLRVGANTSLGSFSYSALYRNQPEVRVVVEFLARNIAQLGLHCYRMSPDGDRERDRDHASIQVLQRPNPSTTRYRLIESTVQDLAIFGHAFWIKVRKPGSNAVDGVMPVPPERMQVGGDLVPILYRYTAGSGRVVDLEPAQVIHFRYYDPLDPLRGVSALEALKGIVAETRAASVARLKFWQNGARLGGIIERPKDAGKWSIEARDRFRSQFTRKHQGAENAGSIPVLEEGMTFKPVVSNMRDAEALATWKVSREEVARAYHIPLPMVGILDHATFSNIREQHKHLYQDCLGPWLTMITEELELQFMPDFNGFHTRYLEFNIAEKLAGSFEEQAAALQTAVGRPWMTVDEARGRQNLSRLGGSASDVATPLNMSTPRQLAPGQREAQQ